MAKPGSGQVVVITGGTHGIGAACVEAFVADGARVLFCGRDTDAGRSLAGRLSASGPGICDFMACDVADHEQLRLVVERAVELHGRLDCLVNNAAAFTGHRTIDELAVDQVEHLVRVNFIAYFAAAKYALPHLRRVRGSIVNINSIVGEIGAWHNAAYSATKGAGSAFTKSLAIDEAPRGVRVNGVLPGNVMTEARRALEARMADPREFNAFAESTQWLERSAEPGEVARVVLFLASDAASFMTGANIPVTGAAELGMSLRVPWPDVER